MLFISSKSSNKIYITYMANIKGSQREKHLKVYILNNFELRN